MEHRRRRPQGGEPVEAQERELQHRPQPSVQGEANHGMPSTDDAHPHRRRRLQEQPIDAPQTQSAQETIPEKESLAHIRQNPREEVKHQPEQETAPERERSAPGGRRKTYTSRIPHRDVRALTDKAGKKALRGGKTLLTHLGGALLLAGMTLGGGVKAVLQWIKKEAARRTRTRVSEAGHAPAKDDAVVLEAIRPQDYHGKAHSRTAVQSHTPNVQRFVPGRVRRKSRRLDGQQIISLIFAGVAIFSACMIVSILWRTVRTKSTNKHLAELHEQASVSTPAPADELEIAVFLPEEEEEAQSTPAYEGQTTGAMDMAQDEAPVPEETAGPAPDATAVPMGMRTYHHIGGDALPEMEALHKENRDIVGWLRIENVLDLPVVYRDNSYYLTRDFYKQKNAAGTIFLDVNHPFKAKTQNLLLHGHNMKDGTMFGRLVQYETDLNYVRWHPFVRFDTLWRKEEYIIFAVLRVSLDVRSDEFFNYFSHPTFETDAAFESYIRQLRLRSIYAIPVDVEPTDALLTLSTCLEEERLVIVARRVRSDETHTQLRQVTSLTTRQ